MGDIFSANTGELASTGSTITRLGNDYKTNVSSIFTVIDNLNTKWSGGASAQYIGSFNSFKPDLNNLGDAVDGMGRALSRAATAFSDNEDDLTAQAKRLGN